jgi:hypothetical protein
MRRSDFPLPIPDDLWIRRPVPAWLSIRSVRKESHFLPPGSWIYGPGPWDRLELGIKGPHRFLGCPSRAYALLSDPGRTAVPHQLGTLVLPPPPIQRRLQRRTISGLNHTASAHAVYASQPHRCGPRKTRLRRVVSPYREGVEPSGHHKGFRSRTIHEHPPFQAYPVAHWLCFSNAPCRCN